MSVTGGKGIGIPTMLFHDSEGAIVSIELKNGSIYRGELCETEDNMNCQLKECTKIDEDGKESRLSRTFVRGSQIKFVVVPNILSKAPFFNRIKIWRKTKGHPIYGISSSGKNDQKAGGGGTSLVRNQIGQSSGPPQYSRGGNQYQNQSNQTNNHSNHSHQQQYQQQFGNNNSSGNNNQPSYSGGGPPSVGRGRGAINNTPAWMTDPSLGNSSSSGGGGGNMSAPPVLGGRNDNTPAWMTNPNMAISQPAPPVQGQNYGSSSNSSSSSSSQNYNPQQYNPAASRR